MVQFSLMSSVLVGDIVYIGSRNLDPVRIVAFHVPTGKVVGETVLDTGYSIQALAADSTGRYLYAGVLQKSDGTAAEPVPLGPGQPVHEGNADRPDR